MDDSHVSKRPAKSEAPAPAPVEPAPLSPPPVDHRASILAWLRGTHPAQSSDERAFRAWAANAIENLEDIA